MAIHRRRECRSMPGEMERDGRYLEVVRTNRFTGAYEFTADLRTSASARDVERKRGKRGEKDIEPGISR